MSKGKEFSETVFGPRRGLDWADDEIFTVTSAGILIHVHPLERRRHRGDLIPEFLLVEQLDQPGKPYGIPAGHLDLQDNYPHECAIRETREETGLVIRGKNLQLLSLGGKLRDKLGPSRVFPIYTCQVSWDNLETLGDWKYITNPHREHGDYWRCTEHTTRSDEVGDLVLTGPENIFRRVGKHPDLPLYRTDIWWDPLKTFLESQNII